MKTQEETSDQSLEILLGIHQSTLVASDQELIATCLKIQRGSVRKASMTLVTPRAWAYQASKICNLFIGLST